jgi:3-dehydroquinate synthase
VAIGIALDVIYSRNTGLLAAPAAERILNLLERLGFRLFADELLNADNADLPAILAGLEEFREHLGGELSITLLAEIGRSVEVHTMDARPIAAAVAELRARVRG